TRPSRARWTRHSTRYQGQPPTPRACYVRGCRVVPRRQGIRRSIRLTRPSSYRPTGATASPPRRRSLRAARLFHVCLLAVAVGGRVGVGHRGQPAALGGPVRQTESTPPLVPSYAPPIRWVYNRAP